MALERRGVVLALVAEQRAEALALGAVGHAQRPVVVGDLVAEVPEDGAIGLGAPLAARPRRAPPSPSRTAPRCASSDSATSSVTTPSAWPVVTVPRSLESSSKARPPSRRRQLCTGSPSSPSSKSSQRFAASASRKRSIPSASSSAGRVRVSTQLAHRSPLVSTSQLQPASSRFAQRAAPGLRVTSSRRRGSNPRSERQRRQMVFSKKTSWPQVSQEKERTDGPG